MPRGSLYDELVLHKENWSCLSFWSQVDQARLVPLPLSFLRETHRENRREMKLRCGVLSALPALPGQRLCQPPSIIIEKKLVDKQRHSLKIPEVLGAEADRIKRGTQGPKPPAVVNVFASLPSYSL